MSLAEQLAELLAEHRLDGLSVEILRGSSGAPFFNAYAHRDRVCASSCGGAPDRATPAAAIAAAIQGLNAKCAVPVPELEAA